MKLTVGQIEARCAACAGREFEVRGGPLAIQSELFCLGCGVGTHYETLVNQIGEQAMKQANEALAKLRSTKND
jgi:hypothetical protein